MNLSMKDAATERMKRDLQAGIKQFAGRPESVTTDIPNSLATLEQSALNDPDERVRGLALLHLLQSCDEIEDPSLRDFVQERSAIADEAIEVLSIIHNANEDLQATQRSLGRVAELTESLTSGK